MKIFLCIEDGEYFTVDAVDMAAARSAAAIWNAEVVRELTEEEVAEQANDGYDG